jgi:5-(carboxyamino)imidazole ribonucleotide synthase
MPKMKKKPSHTQVSWPLHGRIGILGGGQLARMLCLAAYEMGLDPYVLSQDARDPAAQVCPHWMAGDPNNPADLKQLFQQVSTVTFESEFFNADAIAAARKEHGEVAIAPSPQAMRQLQDRRSQKQLLVDYKIPTAPFICIDSPDDLDHVFEVFPRGCVLKKAQGGYDGYGTYLLTQPHQLNEHRSDWRGPYIAEAKVAFKRELALMFFRNRDGDFTSLPLVESRQKNSKCDLVLGPVQHRGINKLTRQFQNLMAAISYQGALAAELFEVGGELMVNELAPRVHNSGHYSMDAVNHSQFHLHLRAILNLPFPEIKILTKGFVMANLIGESNKAMRIPTQLEGNLHWYGKEQNRPGRKMGHLNYAGHPTAALLRKAQAERKRIQK